MVVVGQYLGLAILVVISVIAGIRPRHPWSRHRAQRIAIASGVRENVRCVFFPVPAEGSETACMIWLALGAVVYVVLGRLFVLALCLSASRADRAGARSARRALEAPRATETEWEAEHGA
jgi:hypothetical protein